MLQQERGSPRVSLQKGQLSPVAKLVLAFGHRSLVSEVTSPASAVLCPNEGPVICGQSNDMEESAAADTFTASQGR